MNTQHAAVSVSPFQQKIKAFCIATETRFEDKISRPVFWLRSGVAVVLFAALYWAKTRGFAEAAWPVHFVLGLAFAAVGFWTILQIVRRFHDLGRTGGLFWAIAVPYWALWKMTGLFPGIWYVWVVLCLWPIQLTLALFFKGSPAGPNRYEARRPAA